MWEIYEEEQVVVDPLDVDIFFVNNVATSIEYFHEHVIIFPNANDKYAKQVILFHFHEDLALDNVEQLEAKNEGSICLFVDFQGRVMIQTIEDSFTHFFQSAKQINDVEFMDHEQMFNGKF